VLKTGTASAAAAADGLIASAILHHLRGGRGQDIRIDLRKAVDRCSNRNPTTSPNEVAGGFRGYREKQLGSYVASGAYPYNTAEGSGISVKAARPIASAWHEGLST
jgi:hypothetical protein